MDTEINLDLLEDLSPEKIAEIIFNQQPTPPNSRQLIIYQEKEVDLIYLFEILITILMEGFEIFTNGFQSIDLRKFTIEHILSLNPWFHSIGFSISSNEYDKNDKNLYKDYYCKIIIRTQLYNSFFIMKNINKKYHFLINGPYLEINKKKKKLKELYAIFLNDVLNKVFIIYFDTFISNTSITSTNLNPKIL